jgi:hypothetical protein
MSDILQLISLQITPAVPYSEMEGQYFCFMKYYA